MLKTIHIKTKSLKENGVNSSSWFGVEGANIKTIVDGEALSKEIENQGNLLIKEGYQIISILPITSQKIEAHNLNATIHQINEHVNIDELEPLAEIYEQILVELLA